MCRRQPRPPAAGARRAGDDAGAAAPAHRGIAGSRPPPAPGRRGAARGAAGGGKDGPQTAPRVIPDRPAGGLPTATKRADGVQQAQAQEPAPADAGLRPEPKVDPSAPTVWNGFGLWAAPKPPPPPVDSFV